MKTSLFLLLTLLSLAAAAEYRVFRLQIAKKSADPSVPPVSRVVESTLDPDQYRGYYTVEADETVTYSATWLCRGRTNGLPLCPNPRDPASTEGPDSGAKAP